MNNIITKFQCPKCGFVAHAEIKRKYKFVIYACPKCNSNIAQYDNKINVISDRMVKAVANNRKFKCCGKLRLEKNEKPRIKTSSGLTNDAITDLKILLNTTKDIDTFIKSI
jgi:predicted RNA-binding Zn-ribbon protein involved in translation (DUF1610 family)